MGSVYPVATGRWAVVCAGGVPLRRDEVDSMSFEITHWDRLCWARLGFLVLGGVLLAAGPAIASTIAVPGGAPTIGAALAQASSGDIILVACGTYYEHDLRVPSGVSLWSGTLQSACATIDAGGRGRVLVCEAADSTTAVVGFTLTGGRAEGPGGAVICRNAAVKLANCTLSANTATEGGALAVVGAVGPTVESCLFENNQASNDGGAVSWRAAGRGGLRNCELRGNAALRGGAIFGDGCGGLRLVNVTCVGNEAGNAGGAAYISNAAGSLEDCVLAGNWGGIGGGALVLAASSTRVVGCTLGGNEAEPDGGVLLSLKAAATLDHCLVAYNSTASIAGQGPPWPSLLGCDLFGNRGGDWAGPLASMQNQAGNFSLDPRFCGQSEGDYSLQESSPCLPGRAPHHADRPVGARSVGCADGGR